MKITCGATMSDRCGTCGATVSDNRCGNEATEAFKPHGTNTIIFRCAMHGKGDAFRTRMDFDEAVCVQVLDS